MWTMVHMNLEWPQLEKVKAYVKHTLTEKLAWGNVIAYLEVLEDEWELNQYKNEKT